MLKNLLKTWYNIVKKTNPIKMKYKQAINRLKTEIMLDGEEIHSCEIMINKLKENINMMLNSIITKKKILTQLRETKPETITWTKLPAWDKHVDTKKKLIKYVDKWCK